MRAFPLIGALLLTACQTYDVSTDFDPAAGFATYRTYSWLPSEAPRGMNPLMFRRVKDSIDRSLAARGYTQAEQADFAIAFTLGERDRVEAHEYGPSWGGWGGYGPYGWGGYGWSGYRWGGWGPGWGAWGPYGRSIDIYTVTERSIIIDIYDTKTRAPVWHGVTKRQSYSDQVNYARLDKAVDSVLAAFPPQPSGASTPR